MTGLVIISPSEAATAKAVGDTPAPSPSLALASLTMKRDARQYDPVASAADPDLNYFDTVHPEFAVALVAHWLLWGYAPRNVALAYDFGGVALLCAEGLLK